MSVTSGQQILIPDRERSKKIHRRTTVVVNSRDRNIFGYPSTSEFRFLLRRPLKDIVSIELTNGCIPGYIYTMNTGWNKFSFAEGVVTHTVTLTPGLYDPSGLATELIAQLNAIGGVNTYTGSVSPTTGRLTIQRATGITPFRVLFFSGQYKDEFDLNGVQILSVNCPARFLGFGYRDYPDDGAGSLTAPVAMDTENFMNRLYLYINAESNKDLHRMEVGAGAKDCFHIFFMSPGQQNYLFLNKETETPVYTASPAPLSRLSFLDISIRDEFYRLIDLQNRDLTLVFEITHLE
jgi:hypothetical protein